MHRVFLPLPVLAIAIAIAAPATAAEDNCKHTEPRQLDLDIGDAKAVVFDDDLAMCGSINLDLRSLFLNHEASLLFYGRAEIGWLDRWIQARIGEAQPYRPVPAGLGMDLVEGAVRAVAFQL